MAKDINSGKDRQGSGIPYQTSRGERLSYGAYAFGQMMFFMIVGNFLQLYMTDSGIPAVLVGGIFIVAKVWDAVNDPLFGIIVDKSRLKSGKFIPWVRLSSFLIPAATILLFAIPADVSVQIKAIWAAVAYMLWDTAYTICDVPIFALATSMTKDIKERDWLYLLNRLFMFVGGLLVAILVPLLFPSIGWTMTVAIMSVLAMATMLPTGFKARERHHVDSGKSASVGDLLRYLASNKPLLVFNGALIVAALTNTATAITNYVAIYCLGGTEWISVLGLVMTLPMLVSILLAKQLIRRIDKFTIYMVCMGCNLILGVLMYFAGYGNMALFFAIIVARAFFVSTGGILVVMFTADCAEYGHFVTGERAQGMAFSIQTFSAKLTAALAGAIGMFVLGAVGFVEGEGAVQTVGTIEWIWRMYTILPVIAGAVSFLLLLFGYRLRDCDVALMARVNAGEITEDEARGGFSRQYADRAPNRDK
ncbi:MAG: MFS transporter [Clostridiales Family XIII bacterium]|nr:MFS transporter [Clostridiales Family XIII bacterium]